MRVRVGMGVTVAMRAWVRVGVRVRVRVAVKHLFKDGTIDYIGVGSVHRCRIAS